MNKVFNEFVYKISQDQIEKIEEYFFENNIKNYYFYETKEGTFLVLVFEEKQEKIFLPFNLEFVENRTTTSEDWVKNLITKPFEFIEGVYVDPDHNNVDGEIVIRITPGLAFGTGLHDTTKLSAKFLKKYLRPGMDVLDLGCGSAILSILAKKLGADRVLGVDNDPLAVEAAKENVERNNVDVEIRQSDLFSNVDGKFDLIVSNIIAEILIEALKDLPKFLKKDGVVILSGIIDSKLPLFKNYNIVEHWRSNEWNALVIKI
ncbi:ribosomal protein L11 methyltransferase [Thermosipho africanus TCF52B]|uniref:Ribosomal protein L11 methyltransferase n=1 Tax=Thermosipho africanus (strain TCF52B) TaxID=484019 RepID=PRMA_THEAB|nr:RecName: Full=Ribosomal protein L11 methyltransferase; Short=L11 Mtase [Thermosipho africanus TCF52B]ACJ74911.1 ribosomal protein L11 methyltransferase [Thermosipho africanus TCF52B]